MNSRAIPAPATEVSMKKKALLLFCLCYLPGLIACTPQKASPVQPTASEVPTATAIIASATPTLKATQTLKATVTPAPTLTPTAIPTPTLSPTVFPYPNMFWPQANFTIGDVSWGPWCPLRGQNVSCETEYRMYSNNRCLVGMSCYDACGHYYSVDTIRDTDGPYSFVDGCK